MSIPLLLPEHGAGMKEVLDIVGWMECTVAGSCEVWRGPRFSSLTYMRQLDLQGPISHEKTK